MSNSSADLLAEVGAHIPSGAVVVALSGGADSAVLAWAAVQTNGPRAVSAVHINHGQAAAPQLERAARSVAENLAVPIRVVTVDVGEGASFENRARRVRLAALAEVSGGDRVVLIGHQRDDLVETLITNLGRGAGARGLSGIARHRDVFVRPLLDIDRASVRTVADELGLPYVDDPGNRDLRHRRNAIRTRVIPVMDEVLGEGVRQRISRAAGLLAEDDAALEDLADQVPLRAGFRGAMLLPAAPLTVVRPAVAARAVQRAFRQLHAPYGGSSGEVRAVLAIAHGEGDRSGLSGGLIAEREGAVVAIYRESGDPPVATPEAISAAGPGPVICGPVRIHVLADRGSPTIGRVEAHLKSGEALRVRVARAGERLEIDGGSKLVRDAMAESGIPRRLRSEWPVVAQHERIAWIAGSRLAPWARAEPGAPIALTLRMERIAP